MNCAVRSSRVTGPKIRVPIGSSLFVSNTAALPSTRISVLFVWCSFLCVCFFFVLFFLFFFFLFFYKEDTSGRLTGSAVGQYQN